MLHFIGIGRRKEDITLEQREIIKKSTKVFLEYYTSFYENSMEDLEKELGVKIEICSREDIESKIEEKIFALSKSDDVSLLVLGDPLIATTHTDLLLRAKELKIKTKIYHNVSIANFITRTGLQFYKFGKITSIPYFNEKFMPRTPFLVFYDNYKIGAHSLFLLDLTPSENDYLKVKDALKFLLKIPKKMVQEGEIEEKDSVCLDLQTPAIVCSRLGFRDEQICYGTISELIELDSKISFRAPLCIVLPGDMHYMEENYLEQFKVLGSKVGEELE